MIKSWVMRKTSANQSHRVAAWCDAAHASAVHSGLPDTETDVVVLRTVADLALSASFEIARRLETDEYRYMEGNRRAGYVKDCDEWRWLHTECKREASKLHDLELIAASARKVA